MSLNLHSSTTNISNVITTGSAYMINLSEYQQMFDIENTTDRCKIVNDKIDSFWKLKFDELAKELGCSNYRIHTYGQTLMTTYYDSLNPKYADSKVESSTGKKYFVQIMKRSDESYSKNDLESEVNLLTLEFNGIEKQLYIYIEASFYQVFESIRKGNLDTMLNRLDPTLKTYVRTGSSTKEEVDRSLLTNNLREMLKSRKRPWIYFGYSMPLNGEYEQLQIIEYIKKVWEQLTQIRTYLIEEKNESVKANHILKLLSSEEDPLDIILLGETYQVQYSSVEKENTSTQKQGYSVRQEGQTIVKGYIYYSEYDEKSAATQVLAVDLEGHNHIIANIRPLLGEGRKKWWIKKAFKTQNQNNEELKKTAMELLNQQGIPVQSDNEYCMGIYNNESQLFEEDVALIKRHFVSAALLFAQTNGRGGFKIIENNIDDSGKNDKKPKDETDIPVVSEYQSDFEFSIIYETIKSSKLTFTKDLILDLHLNLTSLDDKHFVILSGISGTGKTQLAKLYANAVYGLSYESDNPYLSIIPVRPDWTDSTALFGYYSSFEKQYIVPEFLKVLLHAHEERKKPHFIILDEMNLARVEYYLSDYLSGVESNKEIPLHNQIDLEDIPMKITIPPNVYLIGTVNVDETTHSISDKVLDRAFVMMLSDVDFETFWNRIDDNIKNGLQEEFSFLMQVHAMLTPYHLHFGYRTMNEMILKLSQHLLLEEEHQMSRTVMLDRVITEKVLPKLKGDDHISELLAALKKEFTTVLGEQSASFGHIIRMEKELSRYGATQFWR
jgi:5-methylcytosine-specific restriction protein B